jgi:hypothetical protein
MPHTVAQQFRCIQQTNMLATSSHGALLLVNRCQHPMTRTPVTGGIDLYLLLLCKTDAVEPWPLAAHLYCSSWIGDPAAPESVALQSLRCTSWKQAVSAQLL